MFTEDTREIIMEAIEENGWLDGHETQKAKQMAKKMLMYGDSPQKVAEITELSIDTVIEIANQMQKLPTSV